MVCSLSLMLGSMSRTQWSDRHARTKAETNNLGKSPQTFHEDMFSISCCCQRCQKKFAVPSIHHLDECLNVCMHTDCRYLQQHGMCQKALYPAPNIIG